ncbi:MULTISPECIES: AsmA-like C-terminal region-containing protein [unclassified Dysgonomonas]|uniref:AsmA-like C-terminal region-containing protein n=1 Tax=unclassified Dysgonomonas TaxID=2630389 RepID=UPI0025C1B70E|nr:MULTISPECIES: AsmA-like C-terminal region-containing protein [unclassified Dysgonomonas]HMM02645.1 AsmA-like C-terminal region-containing protein [Dysgonomonas sp.]
MKKVLTIIGVVLIVIIIAMISIPFLFKDKIKTAVLNVANEQLNAKVDIKDFGLNLFSNFPNATLSLEDASITGIGDFEKDTLVQAKSGSVTIDLMSLFGSNYNISRINLDRASVYAKVLADGRTNYDIMKTDSTATDTETENSTPFNLNLKKITVNDCNIVYQNDSTKMKLVLNKWSGEISGDFSASETTIKTTSEISEISFYMDGIPYLNKVKGNADATINANFDNMKFTFDKSEIRINELKASIDGWFTMQGKNYEDMDFDLKLNAPDTQFKDILSLVPAMYTADFKDVKTSGTATLDAYIKGLWQGENYPAFNVKVGVNNAMFQYPLLPKSVNDINLAVDINSKGGSLDNMIIDISKFSFNLGGNPFSGNLNITTPMSDPNLKAHANGTINLGMIKEVYPLEKGTELNGIITANINLATRMSAIEKEQYENVSATGKLELNNMAYKATDMPEVLINNASLEFTPRYVNLPSLEVKIGKNDISANGRLENFIAYALKDQTLKGQLNIKSNYLNANDFISSETSGTAATDTTSATSEDIIIPKNIDFTLSAVLNQIVYGKMNITNMVGNMTVRNGILTLNNVSANALGGSAKVNGSYNTSDPKTPKVDFDIALSKVSFAETFKSVESIQKFAPIFESLVGTYSMNLKFNTSLGQSIMQTLASLTGSGALQTSDVKVENVAALTALSSALKTDALKSISPKDLNLPFNIDNGQIITKPFNINIGNGGMMKLEGSTGLDQSINYKGTVTLPKSLANNYINNVPITIGGTFSSPKIGVDTKALVTDAASSIVSGLLGGKSDGTGTSLSEEKAKQIEKIRTEADNSAKKLVEEAQKQSDNLVAKAGSNALAKAAAKGAGKKLVDEAEKQGQNLRNKAEEQIKKIEGETAATTE